MNIKKSLRIIFRNKIYSLLNIAGLAIGITAAALIFLWVESKVNFNKAIPNNQNLYLVCSHYKLASGAYKTYYETPNAMAETLKEEFPEVERSTRYKSEPLIFIPENTTHSFEEKGAYADSTLFSMIDMKFVSGDVSSVFNQQNAIVISQKMAQKIYGLENPIGKGLFNNGQLYEITGVFKDLPANTYFQFDWLFPFHVVLQEYEKKMLVHVWGTMWLETFVELKSNVDVDQLNEKLKPLSARKGGKGYEVSQVFLYLLNKMHLYGEFEDGMETGSGFIKTVYLFVLVGILILLIACINFMNLSTARSQKRALEVGVRKTFGTKRKHLIQQFLVEAGLITLISLFLSIGLIYLSLPLFNGLIDAQLSFDLTNPVIVIGMLLIALFCTFAAGSYPALYLSSFNPVTTLKMQKATKGSSVAWIRQGLVVFQFSMAFILICITYVIFLQIRLVQNRDLGIERENLVTFAITKELRDSYTAVLDELSMITQIESSGFSSNTLFKADMRTNPWYWNGKDPNDDASISLNFITEGLIDAAGVKLISGALIDPSGVDSEGRRKILINETLAKRMGEEGRIGGKLGQSEDFKWEIGGIVKNFVFDDPYAIEPESMIFFYGPKKVSLLFVRIKPDADRYETIGKVQAVLNKFTPYNAFEPTFMTETFDRMFESESLIKKLSGLFAALAIFISCLGLLGLSAFSAEQRTKEIGIRKVLGAKTADILLLLAKLYLALLAVSFAIGIPLSLYLAHRYLKDYAYRITLTWDIFVGVALVITLIALLTVSFLSLRAAISNPVKSIKSE